MAVKRQIPSLGFDLLTLLLLVFVIISIVVSIGVIRNPKNIGKSSAYTRLECSVTIPNDIYVRKGYKVTVTPKIISNTANGYIVDYDAALKGSGGQFDWDPDTAYTYPYSTVIRGIIKDYSAGTLSVCVNAKYEGVSGCCGSGLVHVM